MENIKDEQILAVDNVGEKEVSCDKTNAEISLGKFKNVDALLNAYNSLQAEFTKRCQKIKELEGNADKTVDTVAVPVQNGGAIADIQKEITQEEKEEIVKEYLKGIIGNGKNMAFIDDDGTAIKTLIKKPKTIDEAGSLAKSIFNN